jgi:hypothetical protein
MRTVVFKRIEIIDLYDEVARDVKSGTVAFQDSRVKNLLKILAESLEPWKYDEVKGHLEYLSMKV